ncbi:MAG TPA: hypothetical protein VKK19_13910 [Candidatus Dormibacteraeota bacterium]|nr:hypothetical protein [Candidatus Dormibacteraeota bacterium]
MLRALAATNSHSQAGTSPRRCRASVVYQPGRLLPLTKHNVSKGGRVNMKAIHYIRRLVGVLTGLAAALGAAVLGAPAAFAATGTFPPPGPGSPSGPVAPPAVTHTHAAVTGGMAGWQIALIAVGAAVLGAIVAVLLDRARAARRHRPATAT